ncbi:hypothetical protein [Streptomyces canus]|uniref:hypothetical protein n=1 Tax=Streptomyces canus TaxID=58343 RepID=UPI0030E50200
MNVKNLTEEIELIVEIGDAEDALDLARRLVRQGDSARAIDVRRTVARGILDRDALRAVAAGIAQAAYRATLFNWGAVTADLAEAEAGIRTWLNGEAAMPPAERRARNARQWTEKQRFEERVNAYNERVEYVNRERGRALNKAQAAATRAKTCMRCFQVPAANGECGC